MEALECHFYERNSIIISEGTKKKNGKKYSNYLLQESSQGLPSMKFVCIGNRVGASKFKD